MKIELVNNRGKKWEQFVDSYIKGFAFLNNVLLSEKEMYNVLIDAIRVNNLNRQLLELNGNFSVVLNFQGSIYLIADKLKTYPLLYSNINGEWLITDQSKVILDEMSNYDYDVMGVVTLLTCGYLEGERTLFKNCKIVPAGNYIVIEDKAIVHEYHKHIYEKVNLSDKQIMNEPVEIIESSIKRMLLSIGNRPIWLPLSGGYDSRLIACLLKKLNAKNVKCYTYGTPKSFEVEISRKVAETLGFPWYYVEYTQEKYLSVVETLTDDDYILWAMNLNTISHQQDFIAFKELREKGVIEDNAIIVPGHTGDLYARSHIPLHLLDKNKSVAELIYHVFYVLNEPKKKYKTLIFEDFDNDLNSITTKNNKELAVDLFTNWNIKSRQANFIVNSARIYEYFGNDWRVPLWDDELSNFWLSLPLEKNSNQLLFNKFMFENYFTPYCVDFYKKDDNSSNIVSKINLPLNLKRKIKSQLLKFKYFSNRYNINGLNYKTSFYLKKMHGFKSDFITLDETNTNSVLALYQMFLLKNYINDK